MTRKSGKNQRARFKERQRPCSVRHNYLKHATHYST